MKDNNISWIKKKQQLSLDAMKTPNRFDDSIYARAHTVKQRDKQKMKYPKVDISDAMFNKVPGIGPGSHVQFNKARLKIFGEKVNNISNIVGKRKNIDHI